jgi:exosortase
LRREPVQALLAAGITGVLVYFFGFYFAFMNGAESAALWAWRGWNAENDQEHCRFIVPLIAFLLWYHRAELAAAAKQPSARGLAFVAVGAVMFVLAVRCIQPRFAIVALSLIVYGMAEFLGGRAVARVFIFPSLLILFMIPIGGVIQGTISLQLLASKTVGALCGLLGIAVRIVGTTIFVDGNPFEVAGGCSGIRSLMAMTMLAALYVHFTQEEVWKQLVIFGGSIVFALIGNVARLFTVVLVAKWWDPKIAGGLYHDYSGFVFFPIAVLAMVGFSNLLNRDWSGLRHHATKTLTAPDTAPVAREEERKPASPISYDY